jgi:hypothetical protein
LLAFQWNTEESGLARKEGLVAQTDSTWNQMINFVVHVRKELTSSQVFLKKQKPQVTG